MISGMKSKFKQRKHITTPRTRIEILFLTKLTPLLGDGAAPAEGCVVMDGLKTSISLRYASYSILGRVERFNCFMLVILGEFALR